MSNGTVSQSWADKVEREQEGYTDIDEAAGLKHVVEYQEREGKRFKVTKTYRLVKQSVPKGVLNRRSWKKFGDAERGESCTSEFQDVRMEFVIGALVSGNDERDDEGPDGADGVTGNIGANRVTVIKCQYCKGPHYSVKCPLKSIVSDIAALKTANNVQGASSIQTSVGAPGAYVPPAARQGALRSTGASAVGGFSSRDELPTLRISNLTDNATEEDLRELVQQMELAHIKRVHIPKDYDRKRSRGFAYISFDSNFEAEKCLRVLNGMVYDHLVLHVEWAKK